MNYDYYSGAVSQAPVDQAFTNGFMSEVMLPFAFIMLAVSVVYIIANWKLFEKAGEHGWGALIPLYNIYLTCKISLGNGWLFLLFFIPVVNVVISIMATFKFARAFGQQSAFGFGLLFLPVVFYPILAFGNSEYIGASAN